MAADGYHARVTRFRAARFVGRERELDQLSCWLRAPARPPFVYVEGNAGVGKTELLHALCRRHDSATRRWVDATRIAPDPRALRQALGLVGGDDPPALAIIDNVDLLEPIDDWLREELVPSLGGATTLVTAGRRHLGARWVAHPAWGEVFVAVRLDHFSEREVAAFLERRGIQADAGTHARLLALTRGHPLCLALCAERFEQIVAEDVASLAEIPDLLQPLIGELLRDVPGDAHREGLEICALVRTTNDAVLAEVLGRPRAREVFDWLHGQSFIEAVPGGLQPHALMRDAIAADLQWRSPLRYWALVEQLMLFFLGRAPAEWLFVAQRVPGWSAFAEHDTYTETCRLRHALAADRETLGRMAAKHEGELGRRWLEHWWDRGGDVLVVEDGGEVEGFLLGLWLERYEPAELARDPLLRPIVEHVLAYVETHQAVYCVRMWMTDGCYQAPCAAQSCLFSDTHAKLITPDLAAVLHVASDSRWQQIANEAGMQTFDKTHAEASGRTFYTFGLDLRRVDIATLLRDRMRSRVVVATPSVTTRGRQPFGRAVKRALRDLDRLDLLEQNPLTATQMVLDRVSPDASDSERARALAELAREQCRMFLATAKDVRYYRVLERTYLLPAGTQRAAAERLELSWGTYRRYLATAIRRLSDALYRRNQASSEKRSEKG